MSKKPKKKPSGRFNLRIPKTLHRNLRRQAQRDGVSLNSLIVFRLASAIGWKPGD